MLELLIERPLLPLILFSFTIIFGLCPVSLQKEKTALVIQSLKALIILAACMVLDYFLVDTANASTTIEPILSFLAGLLLSVLVLKLPFQTAVFCSVWAHILTELINQALLPQLLPLALSHGLTGIILHVVLTIITADILFFASRYLLLPVLSQSGHYQMTSQKTVLAFTVMVIFMILTNYQLIFRLINNEEANRAPIIPVFRFTVGIAALALLYLQNALELRYTAQRELDTLRQLQFQREEQYRISKENIDLINQKCHDLKHQISALRTLQDSEEVSRQIREMESAIMIYDSAMKTGNSALDVVLTEKSLYCDAHQINLTCLIDGKCLDFINVVDLYIMFGNALDNAIESVMKEKDRNKRVIQAVGYREKDFALIRVRNYCNQPPELIDGIPETSKENNGYHGFGISSIRSTARKYGGDIAIETGTNFFSLQILLPIPGQDQKTSVS